MVRLIARFVAWLSSVFSVFFSSVIARLSYTYAHSLRRHVYRHECLAEEHVLWIDMYRDMCIDTCMHTCVHMFRDVYIDRCIDMPINMCIDMCMDMCIDMCVCALRKNPTCILIFA